MKKILLVGDTSFFGENISFLLKIKGFDLRQMKGIDQAINLVQISRSFSENFDLIIVSAAEILNCNQNCILTLAKLSESTKIIVADNFSIKTKTSVFLEQLFQYPNIYSCDVKNIFFILKTILDSC